MQLVNHFLTFAREIRFYYDVCTREYIASCTVGKARNLTDFEKVLTQYEPMISSCLRNLSIYRNHENFRQAGRVALWQAWTRFDQKKGNFTPFAYRSIRGAMLDELKREVRFEEHVTQLEDEILELVSKVEAADLPMWSDKIEEAISQLSPLEKELIQSLFIDELPLAVCAKEAGITVAGIKKRRERMLVKLREILS